MYRILLAEDEVTLREVVEVFFRKNGFEIDAVDNGIDACSLADKQKYDVVILDIMMPGMDGKEVCRHIRSGYDVPIIFLTALGDECDIISGYEIGADEYVTKPFSTKVLLMKVNALISRYHGLLVKNGCLVIDEISIDPARTICCLCLSITKTLCSRVTRSLILPGALILKAMTGLWTHT